MNKKISKKEQGLIKGALRRVFSRSDLRKQCIEAAVIQGYTDPTRPRVTKWCQCNVCKLPTPKYQTECDHLIPLIPLDSSLEDIDANTLLERLFCDLINLQAICKPCHKEKCRSEMRERAAFKKERKKNNVA